MGERIKFISSDRIAGFTHVLVALGLKHCGEQQPHSVRCQPRGQHDRDQVPRLRRVGVLG